MPISRKNFAIILSSPSGAGKTTLTKKIKNYFSEFEISISCTTRKSRVGEIEGIDYFFISKDIFKKKIENDEFYEHANIFGNFYGSSKKFVQGIYNKKKNVLFDIDWQGARQLDKFKDLNLIKFFILPPNKNELLKRLTLRKKDKTKSIEERIKSYQNDIKHWNEYDYIFINNDLEVCFNQMKYVIQKSF